ncbi:MAG: hypothetical protein PVH26_01890 [Desulfosarcina sp.]
MTKERRGIVAVQEDEKTVTGCATCRRVTVMGVERRPSNVDHRIDAKKACFAFV